jgi:hypothetical protein
MRIVAQKLSEILRQPIQRFSRDITQLANASEAASGVFA